MSQDMYAIAQDIMDLRVFTDLSGFVQTLIREEAQRKGLLQGDLMPLKVVNGPDTHILTHPPLIQPVLSPKQKRKKRQSS